MRRSRAAKSYMQMPNLRQFYELDPGSVVRLLHFLECRRQEIGSLGSVLAGAPDKVV